MTTPLREQPHDIVSAQDDGPYTDASDAPRVSFPDTIRNSGVATTPPSRSELPRKKSFPSFKFPPVTLVLSNTGSVARDHLASERTWLSYLRTSLGIASTGVALVQLFTISANNRDTAGIGEDHIQRFARPLGATTVCVGLYVLLIGVQRYFYVQHALTRGLFPVARVTVLGISGLLAVLVAVVFAVLIAVPRERERVLGDPRIKHFLT